MTAQDIFNRVWDHMRAQNAKSADDSAFGYCRYRGPDNMACAVGCLLDDETAREADARGANGVQAITDLLPPELAPHIELLADLQSDHDCADDEPFFASFATMASLTAAKHGLEVPA